MKHRVTIDIAGATYRMTSDTDEAHLQRLADIINQRIEALGVKAMRTASTTQLLAVVALGLAEDLEEAEHRHHTLESTVHNTVTEAIRRIDARLHEDNELAQQTQTSDTQTGNHSSC